MDLTLVARAVVALGAIGVIASVLLAVASRKFHVEVDQRVESVFSALPGSNCGACGNPSCFAAAEAMNEGTASVDTCVAGGQSVADAIAGILGVETCAVARVVALRHCGGGTNTKRSYTYSGVRSCNAVARLAGGDLVCQSGCFGYGDCVVVCPFDAMALDSRSLPVVDLDRCTGCGLCVRECPRGKAGLLELVPEDGYIAVRCSAHDKPAPRKRYCPACCIACKKCEKECPSDAIHVVDLNAVVDWEKCTACGTCVEVCPQKCIDLTGRPARRPAQITDGAGPEVPGFVAERPEPVGVAAGAVDPGAEGPAPGTPASDTDDQV